jgi:hypothetical protein
VDEALSDNHRRVLASGLLVADSAAVRILDLLEGRHSPAALNNIEGSVTEAERQVLREGLTRLQELIRAFAAKYALQVSKKNFRRILASDVSQIWVTLEDSRPARIRGYGRIPDACARSLEADLQAMLALANTLRILTATSR